MRRRLLVAVLVGAGGGCPGGSGGSGSGPTSPATAGATGTVGTMGEGGTGTSSTGGDGTGGSATQGTGTTGGGTTGGGTTDGPYDPGPACGYLPLPEYPELGTGVHRVAAGDFDGDGALDLVTQRTDNDDATNIELHLGNPTGFDFAAPSKTGAPSSGSSEMYVGDFDGDGRDDLLHRQPVFTSTPLIQLGADTGLGDLIETSLPEFVAVLEVRDLDDDGADDVILTVSGEPAEAYASRGGGVFDLRGQMFPAVCVPLGAASADFDGDGWLDVALVAGCDGNVDDESVTVHPWTGTTYEPMVPAIQSLPGYLRGAWAGDLDGDSLSDLIAEEIGEERLAIHLGNGDGTFLAPAEVPDVRAVRHMGDLDGDGDLDLVTIVGLVLHNDGSANFDRCELDWSRNERFIAAADLDGDGSIEIVTHFHFESIHFARIWTPKP